jgi:hypothetical protein
MYGTRRPLPDGQNLWRVNQWLMPFYSMPPGANDRGGRMWVPVDDENVVRWNTTWFPTREIQENTSEYQSWENHRSATGKWARDPKWVGGFLPETSEPYGDIRKRSTKDNDYEMDWEEHYTKRMGIHGVGLQDIAIIENEGPGKIMDRSRENLCGGDNTIIVARRRLLQAARELAENNTLPLGAQDGSLYRVRGASVVLPADADFLEGIKDTTTVPANAPQAG